MNEPTSGSEPAQENTRSGTVSLIGRPNAGKSTLLNLLVRSKVSIVSDKPQTTRHRIRGVLTEARGQAVFVDTPGVHRPHYRMNRRMMDLTRAAIQDVDLVVLLIDVSVPGGKGTDYLFELLSGVQVPVILVLNKIDRVRKPTLLPMIDALRQRREFADIIPLSASTGDNAPALLEAVFAHLPVGPMLFPEDALTDRSLRFLVAELIREQLLARTRDELPYTTAVTVELWQEPENAGDKLEITATIYVERDTQKPMVIGKGGSMLKRVGIAARQQIETLTGQPVTLHLWAKVRPGWREEARLLDEMEIH